MIGAEVARRLAVGQIAPAVALLRLDQREIGVDGRLEHIHAAIDLARFLALGQVRAIARGREEAADAGAGGADALGQVALRHQFQLQLARAVQRVKDVGIGLARERADDLAHLPVFQQGGQARIAIARIVVDDDEVARALGDQAVDQLGRLAGAAEAANHDGGAIVDIGQRIKDAGTQFVDHCCLLQIKPHQSFVRITNKYSYLELIRENMPDRRACQFAVFTSAMAIIATLTHWNCHDRTPQHAPFRRRTPRCRRRAASRRQLCAIVRAGPGRAAQLWRRGAATDPERSGGAGAADARGRAAHPAHLAASRLCGSGWTAVPPDAQGARPRLRLSVVLARVDAGAAAAGRIDADLAPVVLGHRARRRRHRLRRAPVRAPHHVDQPGHRQPPARVLHLDGHGSCCRAWRPRCCANGCRQWRC